MISGNKRAQASCKKAAQGRGTASSEGKARSEISARNQVTELYEQCLAHERQWAELDLDKLKLMLAKQHFFGRYHLAPAPVMDESSAIDKDIDLKIRKRLWDADKYQDVLQLLRAARARDTRLLLLSWWLSQENVREPEEIIGIEALRRLAKKTFRCLSPNDFHHADTVRAWLPYFEKLLSDFGTRRGAVSELVRLGYDQAAVEAVGRKRSAISAACNWLAVSRNSVSVVDAPTLQNAYSRVYGGRRRRRFHS